MKPFGRLFSEFKKKQLLQVKGATVIICNKAALERMLQSSAAEPNRAVATASRSRWDRARRKRGGADRLACSTRCATRRYSISVRTVVSNQLVGAFT